MTKAGRKQKHISGGDYMLTASRSHNYSNLKEPLIRSSLIKFLESKGVKKIEGKRLEDCYTFHLIRTANYWESGKVHLLLGTD